MSLLHVALKLGILMMWNVSGEALLLLDHTNANNRTTGGDELQLHDFDTYFHLSHDDDSSSSSTSSSSVSWDASPLIWTVSAYCLVWLFAVHEAWVAHQALNVVHVSSQKTTTTKHNHPNNSPLLLPSAAAPPATRRTNHPHTSGNSSNDKHHTTNHGKHPRPSNKNGGKHGSSTVTNTSQHNQTSRTAASSTGDTTRRSFYGLISVALLARLVLLPVQAHFFLEQFWHPNHSSATANNNNNNNNGLCTESAGCIVSRTLPDLCFGSAFSLLVLFYAQLAATAAGGARPRRRPTNNGDDHDNDNHHSATTTAASQSSSNGGGGGAANSYYVLEGHFFRTANIVVYGSYAILFGMMSLWVHIHGAIPTTGTNEETMTNATTSTTSTTKYYQLFQAIVWGLLCVLYMALFWAVVYFGPALLHLVQPSYLMGRQRSALARRLVGTCALCGLVFLGRSILFAWATFLSIMSGSHTTHPYLDIGNLAHHVAHQIMSHLFHQNQEDTNHNNAKDEMTDPFATYFGRDCIEYVLLELIPSLIILLLMHQPSMTTRSSSNNSPHHGRHHNTSHPAAASNSSSSSSNMAMAVAHHTHHRSSPADSIDSSTRYPSYGGTTTANSSNATTTATSTLRNNSLSWGGVSSGETVSLLEKGLGPNSLT